MPALIGIVSGGTNSSLTDFTHQASTLGAKLAAILKTPGWAALFPENESLPEGPCPWSGIFTSREHGVKSSTEMSPRPSAAGMLSARSPLTHS